METQNTLNTLNTQNTQYEQNKKLGYSSVSFSELENIPDSNYIVLVALSLNTDKKSLIKDINSFLHSEKFISEENCVEDIIVITNLPENHFFYNVTNVLIKFKCGNVDPRKRLAFQDLKWVSDFINFLED